MTNATTHLEKIAALLRKAESTDSEHEAAALVSKAQQLSTLHAIDLAVARSFVPTHERREQPIVKQISLGLPRTHGLSTYVELFCGIAQANDVRINIAQNSTYVILFGMPSDIEMCETLYSSLVVQMVEASAAWIRTGEYKSETRWSESTWSYKPVRANTARISFQHTFATTVAKRLYKARLEAVAARRQAEVDTFVSQGDVVEEAQAKAAATGTALVLKGKSEEVTSFYTAMSNARGSYKGGSAARYGSRAGNSAGQHAGQQARLSAPKGIGGSRGSLPR